MPPRKEIAPDKLAEARRLYEQTLTPTHEIWYLMGVSRSTFYARAREGNWQSRRYIVTGAAEMPDQKAEPDIPLEPDEAEPFTAERKAALRDRLLLAAEKKMMSIERILQTIQPDNPAQAERSARIMASLKISMREIDELTRPEGAPQDAAEQDELPRDLDELRLELAKRVNAFVDSATGHAEAGTRSRDDGLDGT
jgi:hypothetical protein